MDRIGQLSNVSFGGAWSEQIAADEALAEAMQALEAAADRTTDEDLRRDPALADALTLVSAAHPKGALLASAWSRALDHADRGHRRDEQVRISRGFRAGLAGRIA